MSTHTTLHFINGDYIRGTSGKTFANRRPVDNALLGYVCEASQVDVDAAVHAAKAALSGPWSTLTLAERTEVLYAVAAGIEQRFDQFLEAEVADTGKPVSLASHIDIPRGAANFRIFADVVKNVSGEHFDMPTPDGTGALNYSLRVPKGVIAVVCPWNLPLLLMTWKVGPALACGNSVVVKPSEETPSTATLLGEVMNEAGVPKGVYNVVHGFGPDSTGEFLVSHPGVDAITFTGETVTGEAIMQRAAVGVRDVSFELGGKNPAVIFADCDLEPTIWTGLSEDSPVIREEIFGPCCHVRPFDSEAEAVRLANDTPYGLATSIWTQNTARAHRVAKQIHVGITWINCWFLRDLRTPFGGAKQSGIGREGGVHSLEFYTELRNVCLKL